MAAGHREAARSVLDGGEHGARLNLDFSNMGSASGLRI
jgi:hypothetical protein